MEYMRRQKASDSSTNGSYLPKETIMKINILARDLGRSLMIGLIGVSLLNPVGYAQTNRPLSNQKETSMTQPTATQTKIEADRQSDAIRPFHVNIPQKQLDDLRSRIK